MKDRMIICKQCEEFKEYFAKRMCNKCYNKRWNFENNKKAKAYKKKYRFENQEKIRVYKEKYRLENQENIKEYNKKYYVDNLEKERARNKKYRFENKNKTRIKNKKYRLENKEKWKIYNKKYMLENSGKIRERRLKRRGYGIPKKGVVDKIINENIFKYGIITCESCKKRCPGKYHIDHITPISKGGGNSYNNLQVLCQHCNCSKHIKIMDYRQISKNNQLYLSWQMKSEEL